MLNEYPDINEPLSEGNFHSLYGIPGTLMSGEQLFDSNCMTHELDHSRILRHVENPDSKVRSKRKLDQTTINYETKRKRGRPRVKNEL